MYEAQGIVVLPEIHVRTSYYGGIDSFSYSVPGGGTALAYFYVNHDGGVVFFNNVDQLESFMQGPEYTGSIASEIAKGVIIEAAIEGLKIAGSVVYDHLTKMGGDNTAVGYDPASGFGYGYDPYWGMP